MLVPVLLMLAALCWTLPGRPLPRDDGGASGRSPGRRDAAPGAAGRLWAWVRQRAPWLARAHGRSPLDLGAVLTEVSARLEAGASVPAAWALTIPEADEHASALDADGVPPALRRLRRRRPGLGRQDHAVLMHQVAGAEVACRVAHTLGTPLAGVLQACAEGVSEAGRARASRRSAMAAPRATARLLGWLPVAGLVLGSAWGADPLRVLVDGGWGTAALITGAVLMGAGHVWAGKLVRNAERVGS